MGQIWQFGALIRMGFRIVGVNYPDKAAFTVFAVIIYAENDRKDDLIRKFRHQC